MGMRDSLFEGVVFQSLLPAMASEDEAQVVNVPAAVNALAAKAAKKTKVKGKESTSGTPRFKDMVIDAITTQKERSGSSLGAIKNHLSSKYKVDAVKKAVTLNRVLKKMRDEGVLVAGAPPGRKGAGCFKVSQEEKSRIADAAKAAAKKLKAQQKQGLGKVASIAPKKISKMGAGKKAAKGATAGKKIAAKKVAKKPVAKKPNKAGGKKGAALGAKKKAALKPNDKAKSGKAMKK